jgi:hypothetical protein
VAFEADIAGIFIDRKTDEPVVMLKEKEGDRRVPIWIQMGEMFSLALHLSGDAFKPPRPFSHDLIKTIVQNLHAQVRQVLITDIVDHIYRARLHLSSQETTLELDARPSDAIMLALKFEAPIYIDEKVAEKAVPEESSAALENRLQQLRPEDFINFAQ